MVHFHHLCVKLPFNVFLQQLQNVEFPGGFQEKTTSREQVTCELLVLAGLMLCGANGCWLLSLAACSCSLANLCFSSRVRDI